MWVTPHGMVFKLTDVTINSSCKGRLQELYPGPNSDNSILPVAITCYQEKLFVANGHAEQPSILVLHCNRGVLLRRIVCPLLPSPYGLCLVDTHLFVSSSSHCIIKLPIMNGNEDVELYCGKPNEPGNQDGIVTSARFHSPHGIANMGSTLIVCDTGNKSVRLISNAGPLRKLLSIVFPYAQLFDLDHYRGQPRKTFVEPLTVVGKLVEFFVTWGEQTRQRTGRVSTQGPDQIISYCTRRSFMLMHESLVRLENMLTELGATDLLSQIRLRAMVTLMVENFFSLMRKDDPMPTQLEYGIRRASCVRELQKKMYRGQFHYYTGPKSYYPDKVIDASPPPNAQVMNLEIAMEKLSLDDKQQLREFATSFGKSARQHTVRDKSKEDTGHLPYQISFCTQPRERGSTVPTACLLGGPNPAENHGPHNHLQYEVLFSAQEVLAVKHARRREKFSFFLAVLLKDLLVKTRTGIELEFAEDTADLLWLDNSDSEDSLVFKEAYRDNKNSPYAIVDRVDAEITTEESCGKRYNLPQREVDRIERMLQGGCDTDVESDNESPSDDEDSVDLPQRTPYSIRTGRSATRLRLYQ